jgi:ABC-type Zn2+ transport system substrate-binding protein/surface adhesin
MNKICTLILIIGQVLALSAWATAPVLINHQNKYSSESKNIHATKSVYMNVDQHDHSSVNEDHDHEHDESCHLHLSIQIFSAPTHSHQNIIKAIQNTHLSNHIGRVLIGPPTPPPNA